MSYRNLFSIKFHHATSLNWNNSWAELKIFLCSIHHWRSIFFVCAGLSYKSNSNMTLFLSTIKPFKDSWIITTHLQKILSKLFSNFLYFLKSTLSLKIQKPLNLDILQLEDRLNSSNRYQFWMNLFIWICIRNPSLKINKPWNRV